MPPLPITIVFFLTGIAVWANGLFFLGVGAKAASDDGPSPLKAVGWITLIAGLSDFVQAFYIMAARPQPLGNAAVLISGLVVIYAAFFTFLGVTEILSLDLRPVGNVAAAVGLVPLAYWQVFEGGWMFRSILIVWVIAFLSVTLTTYGKFNAKWLGAILVGTAVYTFWLPAWLLVVGQAIP